MSVLNPLDPALLPRLNKQYIAFYNANLANTPMIHQLPWHPSLHAMKSVAGSAAPLPCQTKDVDLGHFAIRIFYPSPASEDVPVFIWYHGGGMVLGSLDAENALCTRIAAVGCAVVAVDYRLAPEHPFPAGADDAWATLRYVVEHGSEHGLDASRIGVGGFSSGANLAAAVAQRAGRDGVPIAFQVLSVPVTDNTAGPDRFPSWEENRNCPGLNDGKMLWYRDQYLPNPSDRTDPVASPLLAPDEWVAGSPDAYVVLAGLDLLYSEGLAYVDRLKEAGNTVDLVVFDDLPHLAMAMDGVLDRAREWNLGICNFIAMRLGRPQLTLSDLYEEPCPPAL
ncbi:lipase/ esterase [Cutaneotrichosporon oleaginosum]|uniref:Lipase/ esterase n=2 Tax=Cutaneotrichosporon oleaginosum TaxID=879819 RepID=A0A0J0XH29_9TREE|nr:lipase/ esterase [Cutaneotrichosporon oleaginosum]KLT40390.1 lipase/ esterase [Cutaneotrichosporon oleaginosum]